MKPTPKDIRPGVLTADSQVLFFYFAQERILLKKIILNIFV